MQINRDNLSGRKTTIIGFGRSGLAAAKLLSGLNAAVWITENRDDAKIRQNLKELPESKNIRIETGKHTEGFIEGSELVVVSPGVKKDAAPILWALKRNIPVISEIELGFLFCPAKIIAVTGTNGKTTVVSLITEILLKQGLGAYALGNIGKPFCEHVLNLTDDDYVVLEVSTFQLEWIDKFRPKVSLVLNISRNHLDRHRDMQEYIDLKKRIFLNQTAEDFVILNKSDPVVEKFAKHMKAKVIFFENNSDLNANQMAALTVAFALNISEEACLSVFKNFKGIEHRLEYVETINGIDFINDSKSTTLDATIWALRNIKKPIVLIAGGRDKGADFRQLRPHIKNRLKNIILIGEAKDLIRAALDDMLPLEYADSLEDATGKALKLASKNDCILLSPMCASFDMFSNFEERGRVFKQIVEKIKETR